MLAYLTLNVLINAWLFGAVVDMAVRAPAVVDGTDSFKQATLALSWPVKRPLDVLGVIWGKIAG